MAIKYISIKTLKHSPNLDFLFENIPSGNPDEDQEQKSGGEKKKFLCFCVGSTRVARFLTLFCWDSPGPGKTFDPANKTTGAGVAAVAFSQTG
jgi:hypothetical protein